jgi:hypothetical protein
MEMTEESALHVRGKYSIIAYIFGQFWVGRKREIFVTKIIYRIVRGNLLYF